MSERSAFVTSFTRDLDEKRSAKIMLNRNIMRYFEDPEHLSFKTCSDQYWRVCFYQKDGELELRRIGNKTIPNSKNEQIDME